MREGMSVSGVIQVSRRPSGSNFIRIQRFDRTSERKFIKWSYLSCIILFDLDKYRNSDLWSKFTINNKLGKDPNLCAISSALVVITVNNQPHLIHPWSNKSPRGLTPLHFLPRIIYSMCLNQKSNKAWPETILPSKNSILAKLAIESFLLSNIVDSSVFQPEVKFPVSFPYHFMDGSGMPTADVCKTRICSRLNKTTSKTAGKAHLSPVLSCYKI